MSITMIGLDIAKSVFQVHAVDDAGQVAIRRKLLRSELLPFFEKQQPCTVAMEACGAAHHWARMLTGLGQEVKLIAPDAVGLCVKRANTTPGAGIGAAAPRPGVRFVPVKSLEQQGVLALHSARSLLVKQQTMLVNAMRGLAAEFSLAVPLGMGKLSELMALVDADEAVPAEARQALTALSDQSRMLEESIETFEAEIVAHARRDDAARRLATVPGIGPITAFLIAATVAAWLGLVPRQHSTGGKTRLGRITKAGNPEIRRLLVLGATFMVRRAAGWNSAAGAWNRGVLERRPARLALANKMARIAWAVMARKEAYHAKGRIAMADAAA